MLDLAQETQAVIDSWPIPAVQFYLVPGSTGDWKAHGATYGKVPSRNETISAAQAAFLWHQNRLRLKTIPQRNQKKQMSASSKKVHNAIRQIIETVNGQLSEQFNIDQNHAHTFWRLCTRLYTNLAAHTTLCTYLNRLLGKPEFLQIKALAFPI